MGLRSSFILMVCSVGLVAVGTAGSTSAAEAPAAAPVATQNLIRNGGFEAPTITRPWVAFFADGERRIPGWWVVRHSVDLVSTDWPAGRGNQSLGVNGFRRGWVSQFVSTDANTSYRLSFLLWGDPNGPPARSRLAVRWDLERIGVRKVDVNVQSTWRRVTFLVESTAAGTHLGFRSLTPGNAGPAIDSVRLVAVE
ncbi:DUF642 domain-containing protein [Nocardioides taihuensis]|uniref:DUF642 domain-containing protein n=1 Tax=Nocardioides taihuensis TaxID=1835606 RepID=A0ABW0BGY3_9ACTN